MNPIQQARRAAFQALPADTKFLAVLNQKAERQGTEIFAGIDPAERRRRRAKGRVAKASRRANRGS